MAQHDFVPAWLNFSTPQPAKVCVFLQACAWLSQKLDWAAFAALIRGVRLHGLGVRNPALFKDR